MLRFFRPSKSNIIASFFRAPEHRWAWQNEGLRKNLVELFLRLTDRDLRTLISRRRLLLLLSDGRMSCAFHQFRGREVVLLFPDLLRLAENPCSPYAQAILAHEFGHIVLGHAQRAIESERAQLEADHFAASLGYKRELAEVLAHYSTEEGIPARVTALGAA